MSVAAVTVAAACPFESIKLFGYTLAAPSAPRAASAIHPFALPITYLPPTDRFDVAPEVAADLELAPAANGGAGMYTHAFRPTHTFAETTARIWFRTYTTNVVFLKDTRAVIRRAGRGPRYTPDCAAVAEAVADVTSNPRFMDEYGYVDFDAIRSINASPAFMQTLSVLNLAAPMMSFVTPVMVVILPFVVLRMQGETLSFATYTAILRVVAGDHFFGKLLGGEMSLRNILYILVTAMLYVLQMYNNTMVCVRYYSNMRRINTRLLVLRDFCQTSVAAMTEFAAAHGARATYVGFCLEVRRHAARLAAFGAALAGLTPFADNVAKLGEMGTLTTLYFEAHDCVDLRAALHFSVGFAGYIDNLKGLAANVRAGAMQFARFSPDTNTMLRIKNQRYPSAGADAVRNTCCFDRNMVLTGPNASGKTTLLKTTCINIIFSQQFGCGFYEKCVLTPFARIHSYLNIPDSSGRDSLFQAESRRCLAILNAVAAAPAHHRHFCIFDELYSGTNPAEATDAGCAFLAYLAAYPTVRFMLTTHYTEMCDRLDAAPATKRRIVNRKMDAALRPDGRMDYTYRILPGISRVRGAASVLLDLGYPAEIVAAVMRGETAAPEPAPL
jgi:hypothetical protein